ISRVVLGAFQDAYTRSGYLETISGISDMGWSGCPLGSIETESGGQGSQAGYVGASPIHADTEAVWPSTDSASHIHAI
ncbi:hypothetical protein KI387_020078, partial [Taxus chinensis]